MGHERLRIQRIEPLAGYRLRLGLSDGRTVERDLSHLVPATDDGRNVFAPWRDPQYFAQVRLAEYGTAVWPNGVDLDPDVLIWGVDANGNLLEPSTTESAH